MRAALAALQPLLRPASRREGPISLVSRMRAGLAVLAAALALAGLAGLWAARTASEEAEASRASVDRLERARAVEAAFGRYLLRETERRLDGALGPAESREAAVVRGALLDYRRAIEADLSGRGPEGVAAGRFALVRAVALGDLFDRIETEAMLDRARGAAGDPARAARRFLAVIASERDRTFRATVAETVEAAREASDAAHARLDALRRRLIWGGGALGFAALIGAALLGRAFYASLMRPIAGLSAAAEAFGRGDRGARAPAGLPGEFETLGARFNAMAARIESEQSRLETEVAARTADLAEANAGLRRVDQQRRRFFAAVSHELRTPVTVLLGEAQVALRSDAAGDHRAALDRIAASGGFLRRRLDDLLRLARSEDGALALRLGPADLAKAAREAVQSARAYAEAAEARLVIEAVEAAPVRGDPEALKQAALALIDNAVKVSPPGGTVTVSVRRAEGRATLAVSDEGPGFAEGEARTLFAPYAQGAAGRRAGGAGLGLAVVAWIAAQHGGVAEACARSGGGATVSLSLPGAGT